MTDQPTALLVTVADPFNTLRSRELARLEIGRTIFEVLTEKGYISMTANGVVRNGYFFVTLNGEAVLQADWNTMINDGDCIGVWALPQGGGGGSNIASIVITVVMVAAAVFTAGATIGVALAWGAAAGAAVGLLSSLAPSPTTPSSGSSIGKDVASATYTLSAQGNTARIGEAIPVQYGRMRVYPDLAAQPYTENRGNVQYLYQLMVLGQGNYDVEKIQIEDTDVKSYGEIQYEIIRPGGKVTLFPDNVITSQAVQGLEMLAPDEEGFAVLGPFAVSPPGVLTNFIAVDVTLPQGAYRVNDNGDNRPRTLEVTFWAQKIDDKGVASGERITIVKETLTFSTKTPQMLSYKVPIAEGRWQVGGQRLTAKAPDNRTIDKTIWASLRGYAKSATTYGNVTLLATIIQATNNLNSNTSRRINTIQTRRLPTWDPVNGWGQEVPTSNPAWAYADALRNSDYSTGWGTNRINMSEFYRLAQIWATRKDEFNGRFDNKGTLWQALTQIASVGRATPQYYAGIMDISRDEPKSIPAQLFSPAQILQNTFKGSYKLGTAQTPDHVIVKFWNRETWQEDEVVCVLPGSTTKVPFTKDMTYGITDHDHAWREGMYAAAVNRDQRSRNSFTVEMSGLLLRFGDLIHVTHDVPGWGYSGKVISFNPTTGKIVTTEPLPFAAGASHYITLRKKNGQADGPYGIVADPNAVPGVNSALIQGTVANRQKIFISNGVATDLTTYAFGPADRESNKMLVLSAKPNSKGETQITVCDYVNSVHIADQGGDVPSPGPISNLPGPPVGPIVNNVRVEMTTSVGEQQIIADPANGAAYYEFEGMQVGGGNWAAFGVSGDPFLFVRLDSGAWIIRVRGVGAIPGPWATWQGNIAATSLPLPKLSKLTTESKIFAIGIAVDYAEETRSISKTLEIWTGRTNVLGNATLLAKLPYPANTYTHNVDRGADQWFYFARVIDTAGRIGPWFNNGVAVAGMSSMDADAILDQIAGEVTKEILGQELQKEIELITAPATVINSVNYRVNQLKIDSDKQIQDLTKVVNQTNTTVGNLKKDVEGVQSDVTKINGQIADISKAGLYQANKTYAVGITVRGSDDKLYTATKAVPVNTPPPNSNYWLDIGQVAINENGSAAKITQLTTRVGTIEGTQTSQASLITGLRTDVNGKASQTAFDSLKSDVSKQGDAITLNGQAITSLTGTVAGKADSSAVTALTTRVTTTEGDIKTISQNITALTSSIGNAGGQNYIYNPSFEKPGSNGLADGWAVASASSASITGTIVASLLDQKEFAQRVEMSGIATGVWARLGNPGNRRIAVTPGADVVLSAYVRGTPGINVRPEVQFLDANGTALTTRTSPFTALGVDYVRASYSFTPPAGAVQCNFFFTCYGTASASSGFMEVDRAQFEIGTVASGWKDNTQTIQNEVSANATAITGLTSDVSKNGSDISSVSTRTTTLENNVNSPTNGLNTKASSAAVTNLGSRVTIAEGAITSQGTRVTTLENTVNSSVNGLATKASATAVNALNNRVEIAEGALTTQSGQITNLFNSVAAAGAGKVNLLPAEYAVYGATLPNIQGTGFTLASVQDAAAMRGYALRLNWTLDSTALACHFSTSVNAEGMNMAFQNKKYIVSFYAKASAANHQVATYIRVLQADGSTTLTGSAALVTIGTDWVRYSAVIDMTDKRFTGSRMQLSFQMNRSGVANRSVWLDRIMVEEAAEGATAPSNFTVGNSFDQAATNAQATAALSSKVTIAEGNITSLSGNIISLTNSIGDVGSENWIYNPSFEKGNNGGLADGWARAGASGTVVTPSIVASQLNTKEKAQRIDVTGLANGVWARIGNPGDRRISVKPGTPVTISAYVRGTPKLNSRVELQFLDSNGSGVSGSGVAAYTPLGNDFVRISHTAIAGAGTVECNFFVVCVGTDGVSNTVFMEADRVQLEFSPAMSGWRDNGQSLATDQGALSTAIDGLNSTVSKQGGDISSVSTRTTTLENTINSTTNGLATKASASSVTNMGSRVTEVEGNLTTTSNNVTILTNTIAGMNGGVNLLPAEYTTFGKVAPAMNKSGYMTSSTVANDKAIGKYLLRLQVSATNQSAYFYLASSGSDWTMKLKPNKKYVVSYWVQADANRFMSVRLRYLNSAGSAVEVQLATVAVTTELKRVSAVITTPADLVEDCTMVFFQTPAANSASNHLYDGFMVEEMIGTNSTPSSFSQGGAGRQALATALAVDSLQTEVTQTGTDLKAEITRINQLRTDVNGNTSDLKDETTNRVNADGALSTRINTAQTTANGASSSASTALTTANEVKGAAQSTFTVKLAVTSNGIYHAAGFGQSLDNSSGVLQSTFAVLTDRFVILNATNNTLVSPFAIQNGQVIIRDALITKAAIQNAIIGSSISSAAMTTYGQPRMTTDYNSGEMIIRNNARNGRYIHVREDGIFLVADGMIVVEMSMN